MLKNLLIRAFRRIQAGAQQETSSIEILRRAAALLELGQIENARRACVALLAREPGQPDASNLLGLIALKLQEFELASEHFAEALALRPDVADYHNNLGTALTELWRPEEALAAYRRATELDPHHPTAQRNLLYLINLLPEYGAEVRYREHCRWADRHAPARVGSQRRYANARDPEKTLRVGYVSADLRSHAVGQFIEPVLAGHDRACVTVVCYSNNANADDATRRMRQSVSEWRDISGADDTAVAGLIERDGIDVLIDLSGHTRGNRLLVFSMKPAPVQVTFLGYPATTGLAAIDYRITDPVVDPPGSERYYREKLFRLPTGLWCYRPVGDTPDIGGLPAAASGLVTFGSMNSVIKLNARVIDTWSKILVAVPESRLLIATVPKGEPRIRIAEQFAASGIAETRLEFVERRAPKEFTELFARIDIALDPFPCGGGTSTCESLWMGVPVITLAGDEFRARAGLSILSCAGLGRLIAYNLDEYVDQSIALAADIAALSNLRRNLRRNLLESRFCDVGGYVAALELAYRTMWREWCRA